MSAPECYMFSYHLYFLKISKLIWYVWSFRNTSTLFLNVFIESADTTSSGYLLSSVLFESEGRILCFIPLGGVKCCINEDTVLLLSGGNNKLSLN